MALASFSLRARRALQTWQMTLASLLRQFDALLLAEAEFTQPVAQFGRRGQFLDANGGAGRDLAQWTDRRTGTMAFDNFDTMPPVFSQRHNVGQGRRRGKRVFATGLAIFGFASSPLAIMECF